MILSCDTPVVAILPPDVLMVSTSTVKPIATAVLPKKQKHPVKPLKAIRELIKAKKAVKQMRKNSPAEQSGAQTVLIAIGAIGLVIGFVVFLFVDLAGGGLIAAIGLLFLIIGLASNTGSGTSTKYPNRQHEEQQEPKKEYQDVVYLKNGSIIRGMIIEQIPNKTLKIQTKDRSVFVYKYDEIEKITKELVE